MHNLILLPVAEEELDEAYLWYLDRNPDIAEEFEQTVYRLMDLIRPDPTRFAILDGGHRSVLVGKFPYLIIFRVEPDQTVVIVAFAHTSRRPGYWSDR